MKHKFLLSLLPIVASSGVANAVDFNEKFYGKMNAKIGYNAVLYQGAVSDSIKFAKEAGQENNPVAHSINASVAFDVFYKATRVIHPFVGLEVGGGIRS